MTMLRQESLVPKWKRKKKEKDRQFLSDEISRIQETFRTIQDNIDFDGNLSTSSVFKLYSANIIDLKMLIESKLLRNENVVKGLAKTIGGSCCWQDQHQGRDRCCGRHLRPGP